MSSSPRRSPVRAALFGLGFTALGAGLTLASGAVAGPGGHGGTPGSHLLRVFEDLDLRPEQQKLVTAFKDDAREAMKDHHAERRADAQAWVTLVREDKLTRALMHQRIDQKIATMKDDMHEMADQVFDLYASLDQVQRAALVDKVEGHLDRMDSEGAGHRGHR
jgi:Spy/CpxP family protein refolding chaperone